MNPIETLGLALGAGFSSGLNLYATVATLGLLQRFGVLHLPPSLQVLSHPWVLGIAIALYLVEFCADKIPYFDTVWDAIHTFIRPPAAALLAYAAAGGAAPPSMPPPSPSAIGYLVLAKTSSPFGWPGWLRPTRLPRSSWLPRS